MKEDRPGLIWRPRGTYREHYIRVIRRIGDPEDSAGEHAIVEIAECAEEPGVVGRSYRMCIRGGPVWSTALKGRDLAVALEAPHIMEMFGMKKQEPAAGPWDPFAEPEPVEEDPFAEPPRPVIYLTNAASVRAARNGNARQETALRVGPGDQWSIQGNPDPKRGELGRGTVFELVPGPGLVDSVRKSSLSAAQYREAYLEGPAPPAPGARPSEVPRSWLDLSPGRLKARAAFGRTRGQMVEVQAGDNLTAGPSAKDAAVGLCYRVWAAYLLIKAGWRVILDGEEIPEAEAEGLLERSEA